MLTKTQLDQLKTDLAKLDKSELLDFAIENTRTIDGLKEMLNGARHLIGCYQESRLSAEFSPEANLHDFTFSVTDDLVKANPDVTEIATVIATQANEYIKNRIKFGEVVG